MGKEQKRANGRNIPMDMPAKLLGGKELASVMESMLTLHNQKKELIEALEGIIDLIPMTRDTIKQLTFARGTLLKHKEVPNGKDTRNMP